MNITHIEEVYTENQYRITWDIHGHVFTTYCLPNVKIMVESKHNRVPKNIKEILTRNSQIVIRSIEQGKEPQMVFPTIPYSYLPKVEESKPVVKEKKKRPSRAKLAVTERESRKLAVLRMYQEGWDKEDIMTETGFTSNSITRWINLYNKENNPSLFVKPKRTNKQVIANLERDKRKKEVFGLYRDGWNREDIMRETGLKQNSVTRWINEYHKLFDEKKSA